ncbi:MAG: pilus assembly protein TadG-related protein [Candidatus Sulfotelmatobacter sp.]
MLPPLIRRARKNTGPRSKQRGFTMAFVAITMVAIISMAALSIDLGTLYEAKAEAQRAADAAALAAAQVISTSGITGDPTNGPTDGSWTAACGAGGLATLAATNVANQNLIGGNVPSKVTVNYGTSAGVGTATSCTGLGAAFAANPVVQVYVQQAKLPTFFARIFSLIPGGTFSNSGVSATAAAEAFNPSSSSPMVPVRPRCVKPWMVPNFDPGHGAGAVPFVSASTGALTTPGTSTSGVIGETFSLVPDCGFSGGRRSRPCTISESPQAKSGPPPTLDYVPGQTPSSSIAIASNSKIAACSEASRNDYTKAVAGCDQTTIYACGVSGAGNAVDLTEDPGPPRNDSANAAECLINADGAGPDLGQDVLVPDTAGPPYNYPFQINAGTESALVTAGGIASGSQISSSPSIVSLPIYDNTVAPTIGTGSTGTIPVTIVGFLQVFINSVNSGTGAINVTVMNIAGCGNSAASPPVYGTSPVPVRLITPPVAATP